MPINMEQTTGADAEVFAAAARLVEALAVERTADEEADNAFALGERGEAMEQRHRTVETFAQASARAALELACVKATTLAGASAKAEAIKTWLRDSLDWPHPRLSPDPESMLLRSLVGDVLRVCPDDDAYASKAA
jgi:hypothetical protein